MIFLPHLIQEGNENYCHPSSTVRAQRIFNQTQYMSTGTMLWNSESYSSNTSSRSGSSSTNVNEPFDWTSSIDSNDEYDYNQRRIDLYNQTNSSYPDGMNVSDIPRDRSFDNEIINYNVLQLQLQMTWDEEDERRPSLHSRTMAYRSPFQDISNKRKI